MPIKDSELVLGIMSGSSLDGLDIAICEIPKNALDQTQIILSETIELESEMRTRLAAFEELDIKALYKLNADFSIFVAEAILILLAKYKVHIDYISFHGHTILHQPEQHYSTQLGNGGLLAALTGLPVICDFRMIDVGLGGTGAPLAPLIDKLLYRQFDFSINLGGIANITALCTERLIAFDICPCNQLLNWLAGFRGFAFDSGGRIAASGLMNSSLLNSLQSTEYLKRAYPKSLDNNWITETFRPVYQNVDENIEDYLFTTSFFIAEEIKKAIKMVIGNESIVKENYTCMLAGGGAHNKFLVDQLRVTLNTINTKLIVPEADIIDYKEAMLMCLLGFCRKNNIINTFKEVTGASNDSIGGAIYQGQYKKI